MLLNFGFALLSFCCSSHASSVTCGDTAVHLSLHPAVLKCPPSGNPTASAASVSAASVSTLLDCLWLCGKSNDCFGVHWLGEALSCTTFDLTAYVLNWARNSSTGCKGSTYVAKASFPVDTEPVVPVSCQQSSNYFSDRGHCSRAYDGSVANNFNTVAASCTHTQSNTYSWWQGDLPAPANISHVVLHNRVDCCGERLTRFTIEVNGVTCAQHGSSMVFTVKAFLCELAGSLVRVTNRKTATPLSLCEILIYRR